MKNPFQYGGIVEGPAFCNRKKELADISAAAESGEKLFLYSERRLGKTSLVHTALRQLPKGRYTSAYIDLWPTDGEPSFVATAARAIAESMSGTAAQLLEVAKQLFSRMTPSVTTDAEGRPKVTFGLNIAAQPRLEIEEVLAAPARIAERGKRRVVIVSMKCSRCSNTRATWWNGVCGALFKSIKTCRTSSSATENTLFRKCFWTVRGRYIGRLATTP
jgi:hypothetical protein